MTRNCCTVRRYLFHTLFLQADCKAASQCHGLFQLLVGYVSQA